MRIYLEITNCCNRSCPFCPGTSREKLFVPPDRIRKRLEALTGVEELCLHLMGEPLFHPGFPEIARICRERGIPVMLTTNGTLLTEEKQQILLGNPVFRQVNFSLQALQTEETEILDNILRFCRRAMKERPELYLNLRMWDLEENFGMPERNRLFLERIFRFFDLMQPEKLPFSRNHRSMKLAGRLYLHCGESFQWPVSGSGTGQGPAFCYGTLTQLGILADGRVVPCCLDSEGTAVLGNVDQEPWERILHSPRAEAIRQGFRRGIAVEELCRRCTFRERFTKER